MPTLNHHDELIDNAGLREAVLDSGVPLYRIAKRLGHLRRGTDTADTKRVRVALGITPSYTTSKGRAYRSIQRQVRASTATAIATAAGLDPVDVGL